MSVQKGHSCTSTPGGQGQSQKHTAFQIKKGIKSSLISRVPVNLKGNEDGWPGRRTTGRKVSFSKGSRMSVWVVIGFVGRYPFEKGNIVLHCLGKGDSEQATGLPARSDELEHFQPWLWQWLCVNDKEGCGVKSWGAGQCHRHTVQVQHAGGGYITANVRGRSEGLGGRGVVLFGVASSLPLSPFF